MGMTLLVVAVAILYGIMVVKVWERKMQRPAQKVNPARVFWEQLPSGWSRNVSNSVTVYATTIDGCAYWWVARNGRTVIEGPSSSLDMAKIEAEREAYELTRS